MLQGTNLAGMSTSRFRVQYDFYATPESTTRAILERVKLEGSILEPACGEGHISKVLRDYFQREDKFDCGVQGGINFLTYQFNRKFDNIITNPPFESAQEFIMRALDLSNKKVIMFAKIQLLEGMNRKKMFDDTPLKYIYVFSKRQNPLRDGCELDENGRPWSSTMCFAWFVWEHGYEGEPIVRWIGN